MNDDPKKDSGHAPDPFAADPCVANDTPGPVSVGDSAGPYRSEEVPGTQIGPYKLLQKLGEGGMGAVWLADQITPVQRRVALKIIKSELSGDQVRARFEAERQALAMMDHLNIAKVLDAGATAAGRPFFVMELVKGIPFTKYCDQEHLPLKERLELFIPVCNAVQHAHQKGIIHRDLKPSNVLIALYDGKPVPKVIDFGIAKAMHQKLTERTMFTEVGQIVGTLEYMAPEQAEMNNLDIDTRVDIYSLGVMIYEVLTGATPFPAKQLRAEAYVEMLRIIREVEPARPSTKLSKSEELPAIAAKRNLEPKKLTGMVQGDLDWIVMKCLEKERSRRYETANQLGQELQRFLADEPVQAGPPSVGYRARKFLRRNKGPVIATALVFLALVFGIIVASIGFVEAERARAGEATQRKIAQANETKALDAQKLAEDRESDAIKERENARRQAETAREIARFVIEMFNASDPLGLQTAGFEGDRAKAGNLTARELLDLGAKKLKSDFSGHTEIRASMLDSLGNVYRSLGNYEQALPMLQEGLKLREELLGPDHPDTGTSLHNLAWLYHDQGQYRDAEQMYRKALAIRKRRPGPDSLEAADTMFNLAWLLGHQFENTIHENPDSARLDEAEKLIGETLRIRKEKLGARHRCVGLTLAAQSILRFPKDQFGALASAVEAADILENAENANGAGNVFVEYLVARETRKKGELDKAVKLYQGVLTRIRAIVGDEHPIVALILGDFAGLLRQKNDLPGAEKAIRQALAIGRQSPLRGHPAMVEGLLELGKYEFDKGHAKEAESLYREALKIARQFARPGLERAARSQLIDLLRHQKRDVEADALVSPGK